MNDVTAGQPDADQVFATLYETHLPRVRRTIAAGLRDGHQHLVEDLVQETYLAYWLYAQSNEVRSPGAVLSRIAGRQLVDHYRRRPSTEQPRDFTDAVQAYRLPAAPAAEDVAVVRLTARQMLADQVPAQRAVQAERVFAVAVAA